VSEVAAVYDVRPTEPRWTHIALRVDDIEATIAWYEEFTPMVLLTRHADDFGYGAWMGQPDSPDRPFILVIAQFFPETNPFGDVPKEVLQPFAHIGIELPTREAVDEIAARGVQAGCLALEPRQMPPPVGYVCMLRDPDGNMVEYSFDQGVYATAQKEWGGHRT
jgi:catechol 2,3-dioxygenase-like lactoylglutathione lyase family enzyme